MNTQANVSSTLWLYFKTEKKGKEKTPEKLDVAHGLTVPPNADSATGDAR